MSVDPRLLAMTAAAVTVLLVTVFGRAVWHKASDPARFQGYVDDYALLPARLVEPAAKALIALEGATIALLVWPPGVRLGAALALSLLLLYALAIGRNLLRGRRRIECGCGGPAQALSGALLWRNGCLAAAAVVPLGAGIGPLSVAEAGAAVVSGFLLFLFFTLVEQLLANDGHVRLLRDSLTGKGNAS